MLEILAITTPIFLLIGTGYLAMAGRVVTRDQVQGVGTFVLYLALPSLVIRALTENPLGEVINPRYLLAYGLGSALVFLFAIGLAYRWQRQPLASAAIQGLGMAASNSGFIGYPIMAMVLGSPAAIFLALNMMIENLLIIPAALILAEMGSQAGKGLGETLRQTALRLVRNPILLGLVIGLLLAVTGLALPSPLARVVEMLADAAGPTALFVIGGTLYGLKITGMIRDMTQLVVGKLLLHPLAVLGIFLLLPGPTDPLVLAGGVLMASAPMVSVFPLLGQRYGLGGVSAAALMAGTLLSFFTMSLAIWLVTHLGLLSPH